MQLTRLIARQQEQVIGQGETGALHLINSTFCV